MELQALVVVDDLQFRAVLPDLLAQFALQAVHTDGRLLAEQGAAQWSGECQTEATEQDLDGRVGPREALEEATLIQRVH